LSGPRGRRSQPSGDLWLCESVAGTPVRYETPELSDFADAPADSFHAIDPFDAAQKITDDDSWFLWRRIGAVANTLSDRLHNRAIANHTSQQSKAARQRYLTRRTRSLPGVEPNHSRMHPSPWYSLCAGIVDNRRCRAFQPIALDDSGGTMREHLTTQGPGGDHINKVLAEMHREFQSLVLQRAAILRRIGTIRQVIDGLTDVFGDEAVGGELLNLVDHRSGNRRRGFTQTCRLALMESSRPLMSQEVCQEVERRNPHLLVHHKDPLASVSTVLNRLARYGEARVVLNERGRRAWAWTRESSPLATDAPAERLNGSSPMPDPAPAERR
jgi:hypothetical protein